MKSTKKKLHRTETYALKLYCWTRTGVLLVNRKYARVSARVLVSFLVEVKVRRNH